MEPWLRKYNYIQDYFTTAYSLFTELYPAYPVTYYNMDMVNSVLENENLNAGTYAKFGVGELSGAKWKKIYLLPVYGIESIQPMLDSAEKGMTLSDSLVSQIVFPSTYGIAPLEWDIVDLNFGFDSKSIKVKPLFVVSQVNLAHMGDFYQVYQCRLQIAPFKLMDIEKQISTYYKFDNHEKRIFTLDNATYLLNMQIRMESLTNNLNTLFNDKIGFYLRSL